MAIRTGNRISLNSLFVVEFMQPYTKEDLLDLKDRDARRREERQIQRYVQGIWHTVMEEARYGTQTCCTFWLVNAAQAKICLRNTVEYNYPWHHKSIVKTNNRYVNGFMKRPLPTELLERILEGVEELFPDVDISLLKEPILMLKISWSS